MKEELDDDQFENATSLVESKNSSQDNVFEGNSRDSLIDPTEFKSNDDDDNFEKLSESPNKSTSTTRFNLTTFVNKQLRNTLKDHDKESSIISNTPSKSNLHSSGVLLKNIDNNFMLTKSITAKDMINFGNKSKDFGDISVDKLDQEFNPDSKPQKFSQMFFSSNKKNLGASQAPFSNLKHHDFLRDGTHSGKKALTPRGSIKIK